MVIAMAVTVTPIENRAQWQALRRRVVGASEAGALCGVHDYLTYFALWARKSGKLPDVEDNGAMERGRRLEPVAVDMIRDRYPEWNVAVPHEHYADQEFGIGATPDLLAHDDRGDGVIQIKSVAPSVFRRAWRGESDVLMPPTWIAIQALMEAHLTGSSWAVVAALVVDHEIDLHVVEVPMHRGIIETVKNEALKFWELVISGEEPDPDYARDGELIRNLLKKDDGSEIDLSEQNDLFELLDQRDSALALSKQYEEEAKTVNAQLLHRLGNAAVGHFNGGYISAKTVNRPSYTTKPTSYRQLRVVRDKQQWGNA
jgi:predicted phage-related endonuclease